MRRLVRTGCVGLLLLVVTGLFGFAQVANAQKSTVKTIYIGPLLVDCTGVVPQKCYQYSESPNEPLKPFYNQIEGFDYEEGYFYELTVEVTTIPNPPADSSSLSYKLVSVVNKSPVRGGQVSTGLPPVMVGGEWGLVAFAESDGIMQTAPGPAITLLLSPDGKVSGSGGCNSYTGTYTAGAQNSLSITGLATTRMACAQPVMDREASYLSALGQVKSYDIASDGPPRMRLMYGDGSGFLEYTRPGPGMPRTGQGGGGIVPMVGGLFGIFCLLLGLLLKGGASRRGSANNFNR